MELDALMLPIEAAEGGIVRSTSTGLEFLACGSRHVTDLQKIIDAGHTAEGWLHDVDALLEVHLIHIGNAHRLSGGDLLLDAHLLHPLDAVEIRGVDRLLKPGDVVRLCHLRKLDGFLDRPALVGIDGDVDLIADCGTHLLNTAKVPLHVLTLVAADLKLHGREAFRYVAAHILDKLLIGKKKGSATLIGCGPVLLGTEEAVDRLACALCQDVEHQKIHGADIDRCCRLEAGVSGFPVEGLAPLVVALRLPVQNLWKHVLNEGTGHGVVRRHAGIIRELEIALLRDKLTESAGAILKWLWKRNFAEIVKDRLRKLDLVFEIERVHVSPLCCCFSYLMEPI